MTAMTSVHRILETSVQHPRKNQKSEMEFEKMKTETNGYV